jgi:hypothetical protein
MFVYAGMGVLLPELDTAIGNSVEHGYNKWICLAKGPIPRDFYFFVFKILIPF